MASRLQQMLVSAGHIDFREYPLARATCWAPPRPVSSRWSRVVERAYRGSTAWERRFFLRRELFL